MHKIKIKRVIALLHRVLLREPRESFAKFIKVLRSNGVKGAFIKVYKLLINAPIFSYTDWVKKYDTLNDTDELLIRREITTLKHRPLISVLMPVYNPNPTFLREAIDSIISQYYENWELCIADDNSSSAKVLALLKVYASDPRIKIVYHNANGHICKASNSALELCSGEFTALVDHDDVLPAHALYMIANEINNADSVVDLIYTDEDKLNEKGERYSPYFKTEWDPVLIRSQNFVAHLGVYRTSILREVGGFRPGFEGSQDYDLLLRVLKHVPPERIRHIGSVLYHWRNFAGNKSFSSQNMSTSDISARKALGEFMPGYSIEPDRMFPGCWKVEPESRSEKSVSVIIPTKDKIKYLSVCVDGLLKNTNGALLEIIIVDNNSYETETYDYYKSLQGISNVKILYDKSEFNYSRLNNLGARSTNSEFLLFLNNDVEIISSNWLSEMLDLFDMNDVGIVGAKLLYGDDRIQHAGVSLGMFGTAGHSFRLINKAKVEYFGFTHLSRCVSAVTGACLLIRSADFKSVEGFDEDFAVSFNDVDLCLKISKIGKRVVFCPYSQLYHYESVSRGLDDTAAKKNLNRSEAKKLLTKYFKELKFDPYFPMPLSRQSEIFALSKFSYSNKPWKSWIEFICPFHRGDVLIAVQVCFLAKKLGRNVRLHVSEKLLDWVKEFHPNFEVLSIPTGLPTVSQLPTSFNSSCDHVISREDFSGQLALSHPTRDFKEMGLNIVEHFMYQLGLPFEEKLENHKPRTSANCVINANNPDKVVLIHPFGGWDLKSMPQNYLLEACHLFRKKGFKVVQIGGALDKSLNFFDDWILENISASEWAYIFSKANLIYCVDSWSSHFAAIMDSNTIVHYGSTNSTFTNSRKHFVSQTSFYKTIEPTKDCSPCDSEFCKIDGGKVCFAFERDLNALESLLNEFLNERNEVDLNENI